MVSLWLRLRLGPRPQPPNKNLPPRSKPLALLARRLGITVVDERKTRIDAEKDNVVEVGK